MQKKIFMILLVLFFAVVSPSATYYVATDGNDGIGDGSIGAPWLTISYGITQLSAGDTLLVRGGTYYDTISLSVSGTDGSPVTIKNYPTETPVIDGSEIVTDWTVCANAGEAGGNSNYANIYYAYLPAATNLYSANLFQNDERLSISQAPNMSDIFYPDNREEFYVLEPADVTTTTVTDENLPICGGSDLIGKRIALWCGSNVVLYQIITDYDVGQVMITFEEVSSVYEDQNSGYSIMNSLDEDVLDREGEYYINETPEGNGTHKVWLWSLNGQDLSGEGEVTVCVRNYAINSSSKNYIVLDGLSITKWINRVFYIRTFTGLVIKNCKFYNCKSDGSNYLVYTETMTDCIYEDNELYDNQGRLRGLFCVYGDNVIMRNNTITNIGGTCLYFSQCVDSQITGNIIFGSTGSHSNGISVYQSSSNILVASNIVINSNIALTWQAMAGDLIIYNNLFHGWDVTQYVIANWGSNSVGGGYLLNNIILGSSAEAGTATHFGTFADGEFSINNIIDGDMDWMINEEPYPERYDIRENNIYVDYSWSQKSSPYGWELRESEVYEEDFSVLFTDSGSLDFTPKEGSPAVNAGMDISSYLVQPIIDFPAFDFDVDAAGNPRPIGVTDIGCYEYGASSGQVIIIIMSAIPFLVFPAFIFLKKRKS